MSRQVSAGLLLVWAGAGVTIAAVAAGLVIVGGPGDARDRRLDELTMNRIEEAIAVAQCALNVTGRSPASIEDARMIRPTPTSTDPVPSLCGGGRPEAPYLATGDIPDEPGDIVYRATGAAGIRVCGKFRTQISAKPARDPYTGLQAAYPQLAAGHPAGVYCYDVVLANQQGRPASDLPRAGGPGLPG